MATYIPGISDQIPVVQPFQPDFSFMEKALSTLQSKYDKGFASVQNAYNQVLNAPLTNPILKQYRDSYIKDSERKLKDLSSADLSLYENQAAAENVFAPFWKDNRFLVDTYLTKNIQSEMRKGFDARDSKDEKVRAQYNDISMRYLQNGLNELKNANPDADDFTKIESRRWVPFTDLQKYLNDQANESKMEIHWESANGPYLTDVKNGRNSLIPFQTWAHNMIGNNFTEQFRVMGTVQREDGIKTLTQNNPGITPDQANKMLAENTMETLKRGYVKRTDELDSNIKQIKAQMNWYEGKGRQLTEEEEADYRPLASKWLDLDDQRKDNDKKYTEFTANSDATLQAIKDNPDGYFANANKQTVIDGWAAARASNQSVTTKINPVFEESNKNKYKDEELKIQYAGLDLKREIAQSYMIDTDNDGILDTHVGGGRGSSGGSGGGGGGGRFAKPQTVLSGHKTGKGSTDVSNTGAAYDVLAKQQNDRWQIAHANLFDTDGIGRVLETKLNEDPMLARNYVNELQRKIQNPENYKIDNTGGWFTKISTELEKESGIKVGTDAVAARNALVAVSGKYLSEKLKNGGALMDEEDRAMVQKYLIGKNMLDQYQSTEKNIQEQLEKVFKTSKDYDIMKQEHGGKPGIITSDDLAKSFSAKTYTVNGQDISADQLARLYANGEIEVSKRHASKAPALRSVTLGKGSNKISYDATFNYQGNDLYSDLSKLDSKYGSSEEFKKKLDALNQKIVPGIVQYQNETGKYGYEMTYNLSPNTRNEFSATLLNEASNPANRLNIYDGKERSTDTKLNEAVKRIMEQGETELEKHISSIRVNPTGINGNPTLYLTFIPVKTTDKTDIAGYSNTDLAEKDISIELNPNASTSAIQSIRNNPSFYVYGDLLRGKHIEADPILKASGFDFSIMPDNDRNPTKARLIINRTVFDEKTGQNKQLPAMKGDFNFSEKTPDEAMGMVFRLLDEHLKGNLDANNRYLAQPQPGRRTSKEILDQIMRSRFLSTLNTH